MSGAVDVAIAIIGSATVIGAAVAPLYVRNQRRAARRWKSNGEDHQTVVAALTALGGKVDTVDRRVAKLDGRVGSIETHVAGLTTRLDTHIDTKERTP